MEECQEGFFKYEDKCYPCLPKYCKTCTGPTQLDCLECADGLFKTHEATGKFRCNNFCPNEFFENNITKSCEKCLDGCILCSDGINCILCKEGYSLKDEICVKKADSSIYVAFTLVCLLIILTIIRIKYKSKFRNKKGYALV